MSVGGRAELSVLRICSVFEPPPDLSLRVASRFDPVGGMQNHTAALTRALDGMGLRQTVLTTRPPGAPARQRMGRAAEIVRLGWPIRHLRQLYALPAAARVARRSRPIDVVHAHLGEDLAVVPLGLLAMRVHRAPMVLTIHCSLQHTYLGSGPRALVLRTLGARLERLGVRRAAEVIVLTDRTARALGDVRRNGVTVISPGIEQEVFAGSKPDPLPGVPRPRVLYIGRFAEQKGVGRLIDVLPRLRASAHLIMVGDGPQRDEIERRIRDDGLQDRVTITGFVHHREIPAYLANADVLVLPSIAEELGSVLVEAMAAGLPVVANAVGGIPSFVRDGENGLLCDPSDPRTLAAAVERVLGDDELRDRLVHGGADTAAGQDWDALAERVRVIYERITGDARPADPALGRGST